MSAGKLSAKKSVQKDLDSAKLSNENDDRLIVKNFLSSLMDSVTKKILEDLKSERNAIDSSSENLSLSCNKTYSSNKCSLDLETSLGLSNVEKFVAISKIESSKEAHLAENNAKDEQMDEKSITASSEISEPCNNEDEICVNDQIKDVLKNSNACSSQEMKVENNNGNEETENSMFQSTEEKESKELLKDHLQKIENSEYQEISNSASILNPLQESGSTQDSIEQPCLVSEDKKNIDLSYDQFKKIPSADVQEIIDCTNITKPLQESYLLKQDSIKLPFFPSEEKENRKLGEDHLQNKKSVEYLETSDSISIVKPIQESDSPKEDLIEFPETVCISNQVEPFQSIDSESQDHNELFPLSKEHNENEQTETELAETKPTSIALKIDLKEEILMETKEPVDTLLFENSSCKEYSDPKVEIKTVEFDEDIAKSLTLNKVTDLDQNIPVKTEIKSEADSKTAELSLQVQTLDGMGDFTTKPENSYTKEDTEENMSEMKLEELKLSENSNSHSVPFLKKFDSDDIVCGVSTDGPPSLSEHEESADKTFAEKLKESTTFENTVSEDLFNEEEEEEISIVKTDSDTDEYEAAEN